MEVDNAVIENKNEKEVNGVTSMIENENEMTSEISDDPIHDIIDFLAHDPRICFKSQQIGETDLTTNEKRTIALDIFKKSKLSFLERFGKYLKLEQLNYFETTGDPQNLDNKNDYEINFHINQLKILLSGEGRRFIVKNRRFEALSKMIEKSTYFSESEMMQRNPLLYEQLIGQYMSESEIKQRDNIDTDNITLLNVLMEGIERKRTKDVLQDQKDREKQQMQDSSEEDIDEQPEDSMEGLKNNWGEFPSIKNVKTKKNMCFITAPERDLLREEFVQEMYRSFLDGEDEDFDYCTVDDNMEYDCLDVRDRDEEEKYFDTESPKDIEPKSKDDVVIKESENMNEENISCGGESDDELDIYMKNLNRHPAVRNLLQVSDKS